jgi:electron transfer flavoprotein alpha subunit
VILGLIDHDGGKLDDLSLEMLTLGRRLAERLGVSLHGVMIGGDAQPLLARLAAHGVTALHLVDHQSLDAYAPEAWAQCVVELIEKEQPQVVMAAGNDRGTEVLAHVAARTGLPMAANCTDVQPGEPYRVTRQRWGGTLLEEARLIGGVKLLTVAPHASLPRRSRPPARWR